MRTLFTSESVTEGHPDKICDQISDGILDALLAIDPNSRCACETTAEPGAVHIMGEITTAATVNYIEIARQIIREIGIHQAAIQNGIVIFALIFDGIAVGAAEEQILPGKF